MTPRSLPADARVERHCQHARERGGSPRLPLPAARRCLYNPITLPPGRKKVPTPCQVWQTARNYKIGELSRGPMAEIPATRPSLLVRLRDPRDEAAWIEFVDLYATLVYNYARKQGLQDADSADLSQEVLCAVASAIGRLEYDPQRGAFRSWLFTIIRRKLANWRAARQRRILGSGNSDTERLLEQCPAPDREEAVWEQEWQERLFAWACTQVRCDISEVTWQAFWRTTVADQPGKQVAEDLGLSVTAVYSARSRVLARLKELIRSVQEP